MISKFAIAAILIHPNNSHEVLAVKRPSTDKELPNVWGLPAITPQSGELPEVAIRRLGFEKLSTEIEPVAYIRIKHAIRTGYELILMDIEAKLVGTEPSVNDATTTGTKYTDQQWTSDFSIFKEAANKGSLCTQLFLQSKGISWQ